MSFADAHADALKLEADIANLDHLISFFEDPTPAPVPQETFDRGMTTVSGFDLTQFNDGTISTAIGSKMFDAYDNMLTELKARKSAAEAALAALTC